MNIRNVTEKDLIRALSTPCATLDKKGTVPDAQVAGQVTDVLEFATRAGFPAEGSKGKFYVDKEAGKAYEWNGTEYVESPGAPEFIRRMGVDLSRKADKVTDAASGNLASLDSNGNLADSGKALGDFAAVATSGDYDDLSNKPTIPIVPTNVSEFTNDAGYLTSHQSWSDVKPSGGIPASDLASGVIPTSLKNPNALTIGSGNDAATYDGSASGVALVPGTNVTMTKSGNTVTIDTTGGGGSGGKILNIFVRKGMSAQPLYGSITVTTDDGTVLVFGQDGTFRINNSQAEIPMYTIGSASMYAEHIVVMCNTSVRVQMAHDDGAGSYVQLNGVYTRPQTQPYDGTFTLNEKNNIMMLQNGWCLSPDTVISTPGGGKKLAELRVGDRVLSMDTDGNLCEDEVSETDADEPPKYWSALDRWRFSDGTVVETIHPHEFYSADERRFKYIADFRIGERVVLSDGSTPALEWHESETGEFRHMTLFTRKYNTYFANGVLTGNRNSVKINKEF